MISRSEPDVAVELMRWSSRYCCPRLLAHCEVFLKAHVSKDTVQQMVTLARQCQAAQLEQYCGKQQQ